MPFKRLAKLSLLAVLTLHLSACEQIEQQAQSLIQQAANAVLERSLNMLDQALQKLEAPKAEPEPQRPQPEVDPADVIMPAPMQHEA